MIPRRKHWIGNDCAVELCHLKSSTKYKRRLHSIAPPACLESIKIKSNFRRKLHISLWLIPDPPEKCVYKHITAQHHWNTSDSFKNIANILGVSMCHLDGWTGKGWIFGNVLNKMENWENMCFAIKQNCRFFFLSTIFSSKCLAYIYQVLTSRSLPFRSQYSGHYWQIRDQARCRGTGHWYQDLCYWAWWMSQKKGRYNKYLRWSVKSYASRSFVLDVCSKYEIVFNVTVPGLEFVMFQCLEIGRPELALITSANNFTEQDPKPLKLFFLGFIFSLGFLGTINLACWAR